MTNMIEVVVGGLAVDQNSGRPVLVLTDAERKYAIPIIIGVPEANAISLGLGKVNVGRPLTHELLLDVIENLGFDVIKVDITEIDDHAYKSSIHLVAKDDASHLKVIDARPSDAIALAVRIGVPIFANQELAITDFEIRDEKEEAQDKEDFKNFVQNLKASDFKLDGFEPNVD